MTELDFSAFLVSRVCHDLVGPLGAVVNGLEVLEDERDAGMRADALKIVSSSANQALARLQFMRLAFGAAGSAGAELDLGEVKRLIFGLLEGGRITVEWEPPAASWPKDWAKLIMNAALIGADSLPRGGGGRIAVETAPETHGFTVTARGQGARISEEVERALGGDTATSAYDARGIQPILTHKLAGVLSANLRISAGGDQVELIAS
jgi:histidine phosphotransferase ChpT